MSTADSEFEARARRALDKLSEQFLDRPEVSLIDLGRDLGPDSARPADQLVLRVHIRKEAAGQSLGIPRQVDGIPVCVIVADYQLE